MAYRHNTELGGHQIGSLPPIPVDHSITARRACPSRCSPLIRRRSAATAEDDANAAAAISNEGLGWPALGRAYRMTRAARSTPVVLKAPSTSIRHCDELRWQPSLRGTRAG